MFLSTGAVLICADLSLADSDTCCLVDALSNFGSYFLLHDLLSQMGFFYALSSLKRLLNIFQACICWSESSRA